MRVTSSIYISYLTLTVGEAFGVISKDSSRHTVSRRSHERRLLLNWSQSLRTMQSLRPVRISRAGPKCLKYSLEPQLTAHCMQIQIFLSFTLQRNALPICWTWTINAKFIPILQSPRSGVRCGAPETMNTLNTTTQYYALNKISHIKFSSKTSAMFDASTTL